MQCTHPITIRTKILSETKYHEVRCGICMACRITRSNEWKFRCLHELESWENSSFITLTYNQQWVPLGRGMVREPSLCVSDLQNFIKKIRKHYPWQIKYYACGEYGETNGRPHYHMILFGVPLKDAVNLHHLWGMCDPEAYKAGTATTDSIQYTAQYITKKHLGKKGKLYYQEKGIVPPYQVASHNLGATWARKHQHQLWQDMCIYVQGKPHAIPRYYRKLLGITEKDLANYINKEKLAEKNTNASCYQRDINLTQRAKLAQRSL